MEEVDNIILHFLRQLDIDIPEDIKVITDLSPDIIVGAVSRCLNTINPSLKAPKSLPPGISHRIEVAAQVAAMCKDLGYKSEVGYQTFLYHNEGDLRRVFMFLIESLPIEKEKSVAVSAPEDHDSILWQKIRKKITEDLEILWIPHICKSLNEDSKHVRSSDCTDNAVEKNFTKLPDDSYIEDLLEKMKDMNKREEIQSTEDAPTKQQESIEVPEKVQTKKVELKELKEEAVGLREKLNELMLEKKTLDSDLLQMEKATESLDTEIKQFKIIQSMMTRLNMSPEQGMDQVIGKMNATLNMLHNRIDNINYRNLILKTEIDTLIALSETNSERARRLKTLRDLKIKVHSLREEYIRKEESNNQLREQYENINQMSMKRSMYTKKILEIINNVAKQKVEIQKILGDMRNLQKEINNLNGQLDRSFSIADETLFRDAKKSDQSKRAYKLLALLHSECNKIVSLVNDTGALSREIVELEDHIEEEKSKRTQETLQKMHLDLEQMQQEIQSLAGNRA